MRSSQRSRRSVIELAGGTVRFTHPLLASVLYQELPVDERQHAHGVWPSSSTTRSPARVTSRSRPTGPTPSWRSLLEAAAEDDGRAGRADGGRRARRARDAVDAAGDRADLDRRAAAAARAHLAAGDVERGRVLAAELAARAPPARSGRRRSSLLAETEDMPLAVAAAEGGAAGARRAGGTAGVDPPAAQPRRPLHEGLDAAERARARGGRARGAGRRRRRFARRRSVGSR